MKLFAPILLIVVGLVGLIVMGIVQGGIPELQVADILSGTSPDREVKVHGHIATIESDKRPLRFTVSDKTDKSRTIHVVAYDTRPDTFQVTYDVAVQGRWNAETDRFEADKVFTKCPSKYEAAEGEAAAVRPPTEGVTNSPE